MHHRQFLKILHDFFFQYEHKDIARSSNKKGSKQNDKNQINTEASEVLSKNKFAKNKKTVLLFFS